MNQAALPIRYMGYARKSTEDTERQALSIPSQIERIKATFGDLDIVAIRRESKSAFKPYNRPVLDEILDLVERGEIQGIVAWHPNRLARNEIDAARITYLVRSGKLRDLKFVTYSFDVSPEGIWMLQMQLSQGQYESAKLSREVKRGALIKAQMGHFPAKAPLGYKNSGQTAIKGTRYLKPDKPRLALIRRAIDFALTGNYSAAEIHRLLVQWGLTTRRTKKQGGHPIAYSQALRVLKDVIYTGYFYYDGKLYKGQHPAIMTLAEHDLLQNILSRYGTSTRRLLRREDVRFTGLLHCGNCAGAITASEKKKYYRGTNRTATYVYYHCSRKKSAVKCREPEVSGSALLDLFASEFANHRISLEFKELGLELLKQREELLRSEVKVLNESRHKELKVLELRLNGLIDMRAAGELEGDDFKKRQYEYKKQISILSHAISSDESTASSYTAAATRVLEFCAAGPTWFLNSSLDVQRHAVLSLGSNLRLLDKKLLLEPKRWLRPIQEGYSKVEVLYELARTPVFGSAKERMEAFLLAINAWWTIVSTIADLCQEEISQGTQILTDLDLTTSSGAVD